MTTYRTDKFAQTYAEHGGDRLWAFLHQPDQILRMETASYLSRPAVEPLAPHLLKAFGAEVTQRRVKQMIGHMVRQIMEHRGYHLNASGVRITKQGNFFASGSRYTLPDPG